jgi:hypothetical protein
VNPTPPSALTTVPSTRWTSPPAIAAALAVTTLFALVHHGTFAQLWRIWETNDNYSHGPLVPIASAVLIWMRRDRLRTIAVKPYMAGIGVVALGCALQILGLRADVFALQGWSIVVLVFGFALTFSALRSRRSRFGSRRPSQKLWVSRCNAAACRCSCRRVNCAWRTRAVDCDR